MAYERRETMLDMRDSLQAVLRTMPATGLDGTFAPTPQALADVLKWLHADAQGQATFSAWLQAVADGNQALQDACLADLKRRGLPKATRAPVEGDADWQTWLTRWAGPADAYAGKPKHVRARDAYRAWKAAQSC